MFRHWSKWFVAASLVISLGGHWAFLQTVAWVGMAVSYSQTEDVPTALVKTFDGKHPCQLCKLVTEGKKSEKKSEERIQAKKLDLSVTPDNACFYFPRFDQIKTPLQFVLCCRMESPPTPPPDLG